MVMAKAAAKGDCRYAEKLESRRLPKRTWAISRGACWECCILWLHELKENVLRGCAVWYLAWCASGSGLENSRPNIHTSHASLGFDFQSAPNDGNG